MGDVISADDIKSGRVNEYSEGVVNKAVSATATSIALTKGTNRSVKEIAVYLKNYVTGAGTKLTFHRTSAATVSATTAIGELVYDSNNVRRADKVNLTSETLKVVSSASATAHFQVRYYYK